MLKRYDHQQQVFVLNMCSNLINKQIDVKKDRLAASKAMWKPALDYLLARHQAKSAAEFSGVLRQRLERVLGTLRPCMGSWKIAWGPCVYVHNNSGIADHVMYAATRKASSWPRAKLVIAIAATNGDHPTGITDLGQASYNWTSNFDVGRTTQINWKTGEKAGFNVLGPRPSQHPVVSRGTFTGLEHLWALRPESGFSGSGLRIDEFLASLPPVDVTVTGFSLGGALSPALALRLSGNRDSWDPDHESNLACVSVAGATPGNRAFADYYNSQLGSSTTRIYNKLDIVPKSWNKSDMDSLSSIYAPDIVPGTRLKNAIWVAKRRREFGGYTHILESAQGFDSEVSQGIERWDDFLAQAGYQHVEAYVKESGITEIELPTEALTRFRALLEILIRSLRDSCVLDRDGLEWATEYMKRLLQKEQAVSPAPATR